MFLINSHDFQCFQAIPLENCNIETLVLRSSKFHKPNSKQGGDKHCEAIHFKLFDLTFRMSQQTYTLQHTKRQVKLFEMHCFTMFITALCYFSAEVKLRVYHGVRICVLFVLFARAGVFETPKFTLCLCMKNLHANTASMGSLVFR